MAPLDVEKGIPGDAEERFGHSNDVHVDVNDNTADYTSSRSSSTTSRHESAELQDEEISRIPTHTSRTSRTSRTHPKTALTHLAKTLTARSNASVIDPGPPPDGGPKAWTQALMGHLVVFNTWGMIATFGVFQAHYTNDLGLEPSAVSWIGSMQMLGHFSLGMFSGRMFDAGYFYWVLIPGLLLTVLGTMMTSLCTAYWQFFLAQGLMTGLGCGLQFVPTNSLVMTYFSRNRSVAVAIMASGSASGGLVYPTIARQLMPLIGFPWTVRVMGFIMLVVGCLYCSLLKPRLPPRKSGPLFEFNAFQEPPYSLFLIGIFLIGLGQYFAFYYISSFAVDVLGVPYSTSVNVLLVLNGVGILGRLIPSYFADRWTGPYNVLIPFSFVSSIVLFFWPLVHSEAGLYGWAVCYGFFVAGFQGIFPAVLTTLTKDMSKVGTRNGMGFAIMGVGTLVGPPIAGALIQSHGGSYLGAQTFGGATVLVGSCVLVLGRASITGWNMKVRA